MHCPIIESVGLDLFSELRPEDGLNLIVVLAICKWGTTHSQMTRVISANECPSTFYNRSSNNQNGNQQRYSNTTKGKSCWLTRSLTLSAWRRYMRTAPPLRCSKTTIWHKNEPVNRVPIIYCFSFSNLKTIYLSNTTTLKIRRTNMQRARIKGSQLNKQNCYRTARVIAVVVEVLDFHLHRLRVSGS